MSSLTLSHVLRNVIPRSGLTRNIHCSPMVLRKARSNRHIEEAFEEQDQEEGDDEDLFSTSTSSTSNNAANYQLDKSIIRESNITKITNHSKLSLKEKRKDKNVSIQSLRQVIACTDDEQIEQLKDIIKTWRLSGMKVSKTTAREIIGRLCNLGKPEIASEIISNRVKYGLPDLDQPTLIKLHNSLISSTSSSSLPKLPFTQPISPELTLLRLNLASQIEQSSPEQVMKGLELLPKGRQWKSNSTIQDWSKQAKDSLIAKGGVWADAAKRVQIQ
ncbi:uncharacterized protein L201_001604 [Kwoniella dendrophila CBS 6074]|uniref:Uncharacterized protein n=1 Tax=Kwoniella dendrophila CBS 6074 TaxID=1295534 RepID=A0AAX4JMT0_9TREE